MPRGMSAKGWEVKKETDTADEREQAFKELEHWEMRLRKARTDSQRILAEKRIEYWKRLI